MRNSRTFSSVKETRYTIVENIGRLNGENKGKRKKNGENITKIVENIGRLKWEKGEKKKRQKILQNNGKYRKL